MGESDAAKRNPWVLLPASMVFHFALADAFMDPGAHGGLHRFVRTHPVYPDDLSFGAFAGWALGRPPVVVEDDALRPEGDDLLSEGDLRGSKAVLQALQRAESEGRAVFRVKGDPKMTLLYRRLDSPPCQEEAGPEAGQKGGLFGVRPRDALAAPQPNDGGAGEANRRADDRRADDRQADDRRADGGQGRRRLGMAGKPAWHHLRASAAMWILAYFGGYPRWPCGETCEGHRGPGAAAGAAAGAAGSGPSRNLNRGRVSDSVVREGGPETGTETGACWVDATRFGPHTTVLLRHRNKGMNCSRCDPLD